MKGNLAASLRAQLERQKLWSRGTFIRSIGNTTNDTIRRYVSNQFAHHHRLCESTDASVLARFHNLANASDLRYGQHVAFEYNLHVVLVVQRRLDFFGSDAGMALLEYWRRVCDKHQWETWDIEIVPDHAHLFLGPRPTDSPLEVALSLMNNSVHFMQRHYGAALGQDGLDTVWQPGFYAGTAGSASTAQVKAWLGRR